MKTKKKAVKETLDKTMKDQKPHGPTDDLPLPGVPTGPVQKPLFGELDQIVNVLELEQNDIRADISKCFNTIERKKEEIATLTVRRDLLDAAWSRPRRWRRKRTRRSPKENESDANRVGRLYLV